MSTATRTGSGPQHGFALIRQRLRGYNRSSWPDRGRFPIAPATQKHNDWRNLIQRESRVAAIFKRLAVRVGDPRIPLFQA